MDDPLRTTDILLDNEVMVDPWSSMESTASPSTPSSGPSASIDDSSSSNQDGTNFSSHPSDNVILELQTANFERSTTHKKTETNMASTQSSSKIYPNSQSKTLNGASQTKIQALSLNLEQLSLVEELEDEVENNVQRKPHFLDEDYQPPLRGKSDFCKIPKPHFLDQSLSPDDPNFLDDDQIDRNVNLPLPPRKPISVPEASSKQREPHSSSHQTSRDSSEGRSERGHFRTHLHRGLEQASTLAERDKRTTQLYHGTWPGERDLWSAGQDSVSVKSFSSAGSANAPQGAGASRQIQLGTKVDCVYSLLSLLSLSPDNNADMSDTLLEMSQTVESCIAMRQSGCIPLLVQLVHSKLVRSTKDKAAQALYNMIHAQPDDKTGRREARVWKLLEQVREYCYSLEDHIEFKNESKEEVKDDMTKHPVQSVAALMKLSFDEEHRHVMCQLGGLQALATLVSLDQETHGSLVEDGQCVTMRKYAGMALTNLTFGDGNNKALLCSFKDFMRALVDQLKSPNDDMRQVTAAVLRNLSWRADTSSKQILREVGAVKGLTLAAMTCHKEATLKSILSALWNLTAHCSLNKVDLCSVEGALGFLVDMLSFNAPSKTLAIIENSGGILRNVSSHIAVHEDYRQTLRERSCLNVLLQQLKSPSLTVVSNSCGTLWNLSARCPLDQQYLWDHGAVPMLRSLIHSKHKMIAMGSSAALKNLLNSKPGKSHIISLDSTARSMNLPILPTLGARKQKALEQDLDQSLAETCDNIEPAISPTTNNRDEKIIYSAAERQLSINLERHKSPLAMAQSSHSSGFLSSSNLLFQTSIQKGGHISRSAIVGRSNHVNRSESKDSVTSTHSDSVYERVARNVEIPANHRDESSNKTGANIHKSTKPTISKSDRDFIKRYSKEGGFNRYNIDSIVTPINPADVVRNNYSESGYDIDQESCDQPIDYSQKYSETKIDNPIIKTMHANDQDNQTSMADISKSKLIPKETAASFGDYQETDLDQPTDYSLRYAEDQSENSSVISEPPVPSVHEDTIKYFCTEGTPYETPMNFSTATSMSDLRAIGAGNVPQGNIPPVDVRKAMPNVKVNSEIMTQSDEKDTCSIEDNSRHDNDAVANGLKEPARLNSEAPVTYESKFSSGMISPEKPINYCEEGTPGYFSRVSSLSSLEEGTETVDDAKNLSTQESNERFTPPPSTMGIAGRDKEGLKAVTFASDMQQSIMNESAAISASVPNYAEETPLMFSRCSSLGSLSGCSVPDQGSIVSEFSRMTSGCISPSELPDSPGQSIPHSPVPPSALTSSMSVRPDVPNKSNKVEINFPNSPKKEGFAVDSSHVGLRSVFEDAVSTFQVEHTPIEFSTATSLSSLTIDDEPTQKAPAKSSSPQNAAVDKREKVFLHGLERQGDVATDGSSSVSDDGKSDLGGSDKEDDILAACISAGMQSKIKTRIATPTSPIKRTTGPIITSSPKVPSKMEHHYSDMPQTSDTCRTYFTENTPAVLSKAGSQSNLSVLSIETSTDIKGDLPAVQSASTLNHERLGSNNTGSYGEARVGDLSDDSSNLSADSGNLLAECIRSGMPKGMQDYDLGERFKTNRKATSEKGIHMQGKIDNYMAANYSDRVGNIYSNDVRGETPPPPLPPKAALGVPPPPPPHHHHHHTNFDQVKSSTMAVSNLDRNDSLSSLSIDSLGSTDGELLFQQCVRSGLPKPKQKQDDIHTKTLNKNFKAHSADRSNRNEQVKQSKPSHKSLERGKSDQKTEKRTPRDPEFERLVAIGAYGVRTIDKMTRTEEDLRARALLEEAIYSGMPKRKNKPENSVPQNTNLSDIKTVSNCSNRKQPELQTLCDDRIVHTPDGEEFHCKMSQSKNVRAPSAGAGAGLRVSPCADADGTETTLPPTAPLYCFPQPKVTTPRSSTARGDEPDPPTMQRNGFNNLHLNVNQANSENLTSLQILNLNNDSNLISTPSSNKSRLSLPTNAKTNSSTDESDKGSSDEPQDLNTSFDLKESLFDRSNEYPAQDDIDVLNYSVESEERTDLNQSNESYANLLNQSSLSAGFDKDYNLGFHDMTISDVVANIESSTSNSSNERAKTSIRNSEMSDRDDNNVLISNGKKHSSKLPYNSNGEEGWADFVALSPESNQIDISSTVLPDLLEESSIHFDILNRPDLTSKLCDSASQIDDDTPTNESRTFISKDSTNFDHHHSLELNHPEQTTVVNAPESLSTNGSSSKLSSLTISTVVHSEMIQYLDVSKQDDSMAQSISTNSLDLDHVKPPSRMGSLVSLTQSISGCWNDQQTVPERERSPQLLRKTIQKTARKKSLPIALMVKRALEKSLSNHGSSEHLDFPNSLLDNVKPPSEMDYVLDMENSMLSVASINSELVDMKEHTVPILFDLKMPMYSLVAPGNHSLNNLSDLDHVDPPSLFEEINDCTLEYDRHQPTDADETLEDCTLNSLSQCPDLQSRSENVTPLPSDYASSSIESTPKKSRTLIKKRLTPKQKRLVTHDRFRTYTIADGLHKEIETDSLQDSHSTDRSDSDTRSEECANAVTNSKYVKTKISPKQRRIADRSRYQTQTVNILALNIPTSNQDIPESAQSGSNFQTFSKKTLRQKRIENADRFRTHTIVDSVPISQDTFAADAPSIDLPYSQSKLVQIQTSFIDSNDINDVLVNHASAESSFESHKLSTMTRNASIASVCLEMNLKNLEYSSKHISSSPEIVTDQTGSNSDHNSLDCDQNSGTESADQNHYSDSEQDIPQPKGKPKIVKPTIHLRDESIDSNGSIITENSHMKGIRGRQKATYISPYRRNIATKKSPSRSVTKVGPSIKIFNPKVNGFAKNNQSIKPSTQPLNKPLPKNALHLKASSAPNSCQVGQSKTVKYSKTNPNPAATSKVLPLERQGTFTKEESTVLSKNSTTSPNASDKSSSKQIVNTSNNTSPSRLPQPKTAKQPLRKTLGSETTTVRRNSVRPDGFIAQVRQSLPIIKNSTSNQSLQSNDSSKTITLKTTTSASSSSANSNFAALKAPKEIGSRIASLWKKVEQKKSQQTVPDKRVWITNDLHDKVTPQSVQNGSKLIRSSTFDGSPKSEKPVSGPLKQKSSIAIRVSQIPSSRYAGKSTPKVLEKPILANNTRKTVANNRSYLKKPVNQEIIFT